MIIIQAVALLKVDIYESEYGLDPLFFICHSMY